MYKQQTRAIRQIKWYFYILQNIYSSLYKLNTFSHI